MADSLLERVVEFRRLDRRRRQSPLSAADEARWTELASALQTEMGGGAAPSERRDGPRVVCDLRVGFRDRESIHDAFIKNISGGGLFVATEDPIPVGNRIRLRLVGVVNFEVDAEVVWTNKHAQGHAGFGKGMGLRFVDMDAKSRRELDDVLDRVTEKAAMARQTLTPQMVDRILGPGATTAKKPT